MKTVTEEIQSAIELMKKEIKFFHTKYTYTAPELIPHEIFRINIIMAQYNLMKGTLVFREHSVPADARSNHVYELAKAINAAQVISG